MRVLLVDDHPLLRRGVREILQDAYVDMTLVETDSVAGLMEQVRNNSWDLILLDISLPDGDGLDCLAEIKRRWPKLAVLILSGHSELLLAIPALKMGAAGYIHKERAPEELLQAIRRVLKGGKYVSADVAEQLTQDRLTGARTIPHEALSEREFIILRSLAAGRAVHEIAEHLHISPKTVSTYRARILQKMDLHTNADLTQYCLRNGLIT